MIKLKTILLEIYKSIKSGDIVYHGSVKPITSIEDGIPMFFTSDLNVALDYSFGMSGHGYGEYVYIIKAKVNFRSPINENQLIQILKINNINNNSLKPYHPKGKKFLDNDEIVPHEHLYNPEVQRLVEKNGHDSYVDFDSYSMVDIPLLISWKKDQIHILKQLKITQDTDVEKLI